MRSPLIIKSLAFLQIFAAILLYLHVFVPSTVRLIRGEGRLQGCFGDHRLCGCSPERIADRTCCCYQSRSSKPAKPEKPCCHPPNDAVADHSPQTGREDAGTDSAPSMRATPCGSLTFMGISSNDLKFIHPVLARIMPDESCGHLLFLQPTTLQSRFIEPPLPPPKLSIFS
ncbi:MAG: hypothetical protein WA140_10000 [Geobacteraceae bacterium]